MAFGGGSGSASKQFDKARMNADGEMEGAAGGEQGSLMAGGSGVDAAGSGQAAQDGQYGYK